MKTPTDEDGKVPGGMCRQCHLIWNFSHFTIMCMHTQSQPPCNLRLSCIPHQHLVRLQGKKKYQKWKKKKIFCSSTPSVTWMSSGFAEAFKSLIKLTNGNELEKPSPIIAARKLFISLSRFSQLFNNFVCWLQIGKNIFYTFPSLLTRLCVLSCWTSEKI